MSSDALSIKYRPRKLADVIGQSVVVTSLTNAFKSNTMHHAYIFGGNLGSGKTSTARIVAAMDNCLKGASLEPCGVCQNCQEIFNGKSLDVAEIDAASNRSIDDIRNITKDARLSPVSSRIKYYIIDECHSLTGYAAEAALKLIEEPPRGVKFILCTTSPHHLLNTIQSRCIAFKFQKVVSTELFEHLKKVADLEKISYEENALKLISRISDGSVRNSLVNLHSLINFAGNSKILFEDAKKVLGVVDERYYFNLIEHILKINAPAAFATIQEILRDGKNAAEVVDGFLSHLGLLLVAKTCNGQLDSYGVTEEDARKYQHICSGMGLDLILEMMTLVTNVSRGLTLNLDPLVLLERMAVEAIIATKRIEARAKVKSAA